MDLHLHTPHWEHRLPDWTAAAVSGFVAGAVLMVLDLLWSAVVSGESPWRSSHLIAAIVLGPQTLASSSDFGLGVVAVALLTHYVLGILFGLALAFVLVGLHWEANLVSAQLVGALFGAALYLFDFHIMTQAFPWFSELRGWPTLAAHLVFGVVAALLYRSLNRQEEGR